MKQYARIDANGVLETTVANGDKMDEILRADGFLPLYAGDRPSAYLGELQDYEFVVEEVDGVMIGEWIVIDDAASMVGALIEELTSKLSMTDYKVTKNQELQMAGEELYYEPVALHLEREELRIQIRELESRLAL